MTDKKSVVDVLKNTSKGKLSYSSNLIPLTKLSCPIIKNIQIDKEPTISEKKIEAEEEKKKIQQAIKQKEEAKERIRENKLKLSGFLEPAQMIKKQIISLFQECKEKGNLPQSVKILFSQVSTCFNQLSQTVNIAMNCDKEDLSDEIKQVSGLLDSLQKLFEACEKEKEIIKLNDINEKEKNIEKDLPITSANNVNISTTQSLNDLQHSAVQSVANTFAITVTSTSGYTVPNNDNMNFDFPPQLENIKTLLLQNINHYTDTLAFKGYLQLYHLQLQLEKQYEALDKPTMQEKKTYEFNLYKVINTTVNAISDESSKHLLAKFLKLFDLLTEQSIEVGNKIVNIKTDPHALYLCKDLLAKKLVLQGATQIASNYQTAFPIAAIAVCVWTLFPDCGQLILAHFYRSCPYLVPFYIPYSKNMDNCEYYKLLGYDIDDGKIEDEDKYLKKVSGVVRLYAAIIQTDVPPHLGDRPHPHGLEYAWIWLTRFLTLEPRPSISAVIIYDFLEVAGHAMMKRFGKQFQKLLLILYNSYLPKVIEVTTNEGTPMVSRLKMFLDDCVKEGRIKEPEGFLPKQWWNRN